MAKVDDVAALIVAKLGAMPAMKLQKLAYYSQAWHLVWEGKPLFTARVEAWANGPVVPKLYQQHRRQYRVDAWPSGDPSALSVAEESTVVAIISHYGDKDANWLSDLTHYERPWRDARSGLAPGDRGNSVIEHAAMFEYYSSL